MRTEGMTRRQQQSAETKQRILEAADVCFAKKGMKYTLISDIISEAGVSIGAFYHYFANKDELIISRFLPFDMGFVDRIDELFAGDNAVEKLVRFAAFFSRDSLQVDIRAACIEYLKARVSISLEELWPSNRPYFLVLCTLIAEGQAARQLRRDMAPSDMADLVMIVSRGYNFDWANHDAAYDLDAKMRRHVPMLFSSLRYENAPDGPHDGRNCTLPEQVVPVAYKAAVNQLRAYCEQRLAALRPDEDRL